MKKFDDPGLVIVSRAYLDVLEEVLRRTLEKDPMRPSSEFPGKMYCTWCARINGHFDNCVYYEDT